MTFDRTRLTRRSFRALALAARVCAMVGLVALAGCQSFFGYRGFPYPEHDRTSFHTPEMRIDTVRQFATRSDGTDSEEQRQYTDQLAQQIQIEPDPLVREAIIRATAQFRTPLSFQIVEAGLRDENPLVRVASCQSLGARGEAKAVAGLSEVVRKDENKDVRLAAVEALGSMKDPAAVAAIAVALNDRDPALQFVGVQSMKSVTGKDYGGDVETWRQVAEGKSVAEPPAPSIAERLKSATRF
jgi:HEAT repeat protein